MCHYRHTAHTGPFVSPGRQDLTAHVDFSAAARAGTAAGMTVAGYCAQGEFLLALGILEHYQAAMRDGVSAATLALSAQLKKLTLPHEMGELFKVMALTKAIDPALRGFKRRNRASRL